MMSSDSRVISRFCPDMPSTLNIDQSLGSPLAATPKLSRPWAMWSRIASRLASSAGWWYGIRKPPGPMRMRLVCSRACATRRSGEGWGSHGEVWCSPIHASLKPSSSAQRSCCRSHWCPSKSFRSGGCDGIVKRP